MTKSQQSLGTVSAVGQPPEKRRRDDRHKTNGCIKPGYVSPQSAGSEELSEACKIASPDGELKKVKY